MKVIPAQKKKVIITFDEYERLQDFVYRMACMKKEAPCGKLVETAKDLNRLKMAEDTATTSQHNEGD